MEERLFENGFYYYIHHELNPYINEALEELLISEENDKPLIMIWRNDLSVVLGRFQSPIKEINLPYALENDIKIIRRVSGGGTVYHDLGNINYGIYANKHDNSVNYDTFLKPMQYLLGELGYQVEINEGIDLYFQGKKISGSAQKITNNRILHHGTLLFDPIKENMSNILKHIDGEFEFVGTESRRAKVGRLIDAKIDKNTLEFIESLKNKLIELGGEKWELPDEVLDKAKKLSEKTYMDDDWTYGKSPKLKIKKKYEDDKEIQLELVKGKLKSYSGKNLSDQVKKLLENGLGKYLEIDYFDNGEKSIIHYLFEVD